MRIIAWPEAFLDIGARGRMPGDIGLLRQIADRRPGLNESGAGIGLNKAGGDLEQGRFARSVAADEAYPLSGSDRQIDAVEQRQAADSQGNLAQLDEGRGHIGTDEWTWRSQQVTEAMWLIASRQATAQASAGSRFDNSARSN